MSVCNCGVPAERCSSACCLTILQKQNTIPSTSLHNQRVRKIECFGPSHVKRFDRSVTNTHLQINFCEDYSGHLKLSNQSIKVFNKKRTSILVEYCFDSEQLFQAAHYSTQKNVMVTQKLYSFRQERPIFRQLQIKFIDFEKKLFR